MLQLLTGETSVPARKSGLSGRPTLSMTWTLDPQSGKPVARWIVDGTEPPAFRLASAA
jgi:hypothetical protein